MKSLENEKAPSEGATKDLMCVYDADCIEIENFLKQKCEEDCNV